MSPPPLPRLTPDDPENRLSDEARQRISAALYDFDRIKKQALAAIETRYLAESPGGVSFWEYMGTGSAFIELIESRMQAARTVLRVEAEEYRKLGLPGHQFRQIMEEKIEAMVYSMEFSTLQRDALEAEFLRSWHREPEEQPGSDERSAAERVKAFMEQKSLDIPAFARRIRKSTRTVGSVLAGVPVGKDTRVAVAKALGTTPEELFPK
jgi:hypothetical protein